MNAFPQRARFDILGSANEAYASVDAHELPGRTPPIEVWLIAALWAGSVINALRLLL